MFYLEFLATQYDKNEVRKLYKSTECLCCKSLICGNKWTSVTRIKDLIKEIKIMLKLKNRIKERYICGIIQKIFNLPIEIKNYL